MAAATTSGSALNSAVDVAAKIGEFSALFQLILAIVIGFILIIIGFMMIAKRRQTGKGVVLIIIAFVIIGISYLYYYIVTSHKGIAAVMGVATVVDFMNGGRVQKKIAQSAATLN